MTDLIESTGVTTWLHRLTVEQRERLDGLAADIRSNFKLELIGQVEIGRALNEARHILKSDNAFGSWREDRLAGMSRHEALKRMRVADRYGDRIEALGALSFSALALLASDATPDELRRDVEARAEAGHGSTVAEIERLKREVSEEAARAKAAETLTKQATAEAGRYKAQAETLLDNQKQLISDAEEQVRQKAAQEIAAAKAQAETIRKELSSENEKLRQLADEVRGAAIAEARGRAEALAEEELAKRHQALQQAESELEKVKGDIDRRHQALKGIEHSISQKEELSGRLNSVDYETREILKEADEIIRLQALFMVTLSDIEHADEHPDKVRRTVAKLAGQCADLSTILSSFYPRSTVTRVINDGPETNR